jgi:Uma2 family endonuclease
MNAMTANPAPEMTLEEWGAMDEDDEGELVDGVLVEEEMPASRHELVVTSIVWMVRSWLAARGGGFVLGSEAKFAVLPRRGRKPDVSVYLPGGRKPPADGVIGVAPDIVVEVVSPAASDQRRDRIEKLADYAAFGVRWYWLVDPALRSFEILELGTDGRYAHAIAATDARLENVPGCEGLTLDVPALWAEIDRLETSDPT